MGQGSLESHVESQLWARGRMDPEPSAQPLILRADVTPQRPDGRLFSPADIAVVLQGLHHDCSNIMGSHLSHFSFWQR